uniref:Putative 2b protein n=1 Tax=Pepper ringspot virus TaxID=31750 RepID=W0TS13_9VIRU|nr:putative 2b protein [Pepper ringspot virus]
MKFVKDQVTPYAAVRLMLERCDPKVVKCVRSDGKCMFTFPDGKRSVWFKAGRKAYDFSSISDSSAAGGSLTVPAIAAALPSVPVQAVRQSVEKAPTSASEGAWSTLQGKEASKEREAEWQQAVFESQYNPPLP